MKDTTQRNVMFAIPCFNQQVWAQTMVSLLGAMTQLMSKGYGCGIETFGGHGGIHLIRNWFCSKFLDGPCTDLFFLDSDVAAAPADFVKLIEHPVDVVMGLYRARANPEIYSLLSHDTVRRDIETGLVAVRSGPAGFVRIKRHVIERMADLLDDDEWSEMPIIGGRIPNLFDFRQRHGHYIGEDTYFYLKWEEMGGTTWVDPDIELHHCGMHTYSSVFSEYLYVREQQHRELLAFEAITNG